MPESLRTHALEIIADAIAEVHPRLAVPRHVHLSGDVLSVDGDLYDLGHARRVVVLGGGKASAAMAQALEAILGDRITEGCVVTKYGHKADCRRVQVREAGHPLTDAAGLAATEEILRLAHGLDGSDLAIVLISGGGSALLELLPDSIPLEAAQQTVRKLMNAGADISSLNTVRKHLSLVKGGRLARTLFPCPSITLLISDVIGDPLDMIASGPTAPDPTTFRDALRVIEKFGVMADVPQSITDYLRGGIEGRMPESPKPEDPIHALSHHHIIASNRIALAAARSKAIKLGFHTSIESTAVQGEARDFAMTLSGIARNRAIPRPACRLFGGETTVTVRGNGRGGRCQEIAVAALAELSELRDNYLIAACGTDGTDGPTEAAGGIGSPEIDRRAKEIGLNPTDFLATNDCFNFLDQTGGLIVTGPTGTNVMDIYLALTD